LDSQLLPKRVTKKEARGTTSVRRNRGALSRNYNKKNIEPKILPTDTPTETCEIRAENGKCSRVETVSGVQEASSSLHEPNGTNSDIKVECGLVDDEEWLDMNEDGEFEILDKERRPSPPEDDEYGLALINFQKRQSSNLCESNYSMLNLFKDDAAQDGF
jgi:hypothetical protein